MATTTTVSPFVVQGLKVLLASRERAAKAESNPQIASIIRDECAQISALISSFR